RLRPGAWPVRPRGRGAARPRAAGPPRPGALTQRAASPHNPENWERIMTQPHQPAAAAARFRLPSTADILASVVVFLVALPLCMGIAIASGAPPEKAAAVGILTGIVGGLVVGFLGGSPLQVSGPAAGLSVLVLELTQKHGWETLGLLVLL